MNNISVISFEIVKESRNSDSHDLTSKRVIFPSVLSAKITPDSEYRFSIF